MILRSKSLGKGRLLAARASGEAGQRRDRTARGLHGLVFKGVGQFGRIGGRAEGEAEGGGGKKAVDVRVPSCLGWDAVGRADGLPDDVTAPSSPSLLLRANLLIFSARLDEAVRPGRPGTRGPRFARAP